MKTYIINETTEKFDLKEGNAGAFLKCGELKGKDDVKGCKVSIKVDPNATYREYMVATGKKGETIILNSDDISDYKEIRIKVDSEAGGGAQAVVYKSVPTKPRNKKRSVADSRADPIPAAAAAASAAAAAAAAAAAPPADLAGVSSAATAAGPGQGAPEASSNTGPVAPSTGGAQLQSGSQHVSWYNKAFKFFKMH